MEFKMERPDLVKPGEILSITESKLPTSYYYTLCHAYAMSGNYTFGQRLKTREGKVIEIEDTPKGFFVVMEFDEPDIK